MEDTIILNGIDEIGNLFHNRSIFKIGIKLIIAKDYPVKYSPIRIFDVIGTNRGFILKRVEEELKDSTKNDIQNKWIKSVYDGATKALYRANLENFNLDIDERVDIPREEDIFWESIGEGEAAIIPDTSSLMDGLISRLIETEKFDEKWDLNIYLSPTVIQELQKHAMGRQKQFDDKNVKDEEIALVHFADEKRKARIALRALSELVEYRNRKELRLKLIEIEKQEGDINDWNILLEAKSLHVDIPRFFITNDLIQSTLSELMGLRTRYMYPTHLLKLQEIKFKNKNEVGKTIYELAIQFGEIILTTEDGKIQFTLQSDWPNKMSPSWVNKILIAKIKYEDTNCRDEIIRIINKKRISDEKIKDFDPRWKTLL